MIDRRGGCQERAPRSALLTLGGVVLSAFWRSL